MSIEAQAVVFTAPNQVAFHDVTCPDPSPGDVVVRLTHSWISNGTEGSYLRGERIEGDVAYRPGDPHPFPIVPGYQKVGTVEWVGEQIEDLAVGETVFAAMGKVEGMFSPMGGHVSPSISPRNQVWKLPPGANPLAYAGLVLTQVGYNCGTRAPVHVGGGAIVLGDGMVGLWAAQTLAWRGAEVALLGHHGHRMARFGPGPLRYTLDTHQSGWLEVLDGLLPDGAEVLVDTVGSIASVEALLPSLCRYGHVVSAGFYGTQDRLALQPLRLGERSVDMVSGWSRRRMDETRALIAAGHLQTLPLITHHVAAHEAAQAWDLIRSKDDHVLGVILDW
jgi:2-desacetyl-2-hydroxyethyl bacteriochlorophyllide A dehydrogenase